MDLAKLYISSSNDYLLKDNNWQKVDYYYYGTNCSHWNCAMVLILSKDSAKTSDNALLYLLQKQAKALKIWETEWKTTTPTAIEFINFFIAEKGFANTVGIPMNTATFYAKFSEIMAGITLEPSFECTKNDLPENFSNLLDKEDITSVICFDDSWIEHNFLIETKTSWVLYHWSSNV